MFKSKMSSIATVECLPQNKKVLLSNNNTSVTMNIDLGLYNSIYMAPKGRLSAPFYPLAIDHYRLSYSAY